MMRSVVGAMAALGMLTQVVQAQGFKLAPALAIEAEDFTVEQGWRVVRNGQGNYMVDAIGFNHVSGERLLGIDEKDESARASLAVEIPEAGAYRLWVRYEYPAFCETRFRVRIEQGGKTVLDYLVGRRDSLRLGLGDPVPRAQHDPSWGSEGLMDEAIPVPRLDKGPAQISLLGAPQPQIPGVSAHRNVDLLYLTRDTADNWVRHYRTRNTLYPLLDAFRDTRGARWEVRFTNRGKAPASFRINYAYNRVPWYVSEPGSTPAVQPGQSSDWVPLVTQDTTHFGMASFLGSAEPFEVEVRSAGGKVERTLAGEGTVRVYLPPYPGKGEKLTTPEEALDAILAELKKSPAPGRKPTQPLCYGGWLPLGLPDAYGRKYAELYATLGFCSLHPNNSGPQWRANLKAVGVPETRSWMVSGHRNPPTQAMIDRARAELRDTGMAEQVRFFDYGDEIAFSEWLRVLADDELAKLPRGEGKVTPAAVMARRWIEWLKANRPTATFGDYWREKWGPFNLVRMRPDSSAEASRDNPRLYVDSLLFYEDEAIRFAADGRKAVQSALGEDVLCGANYSCHPFYYPSTTMYVKWFRGGAADLGRHSEYFWQVGQAGPMVNGYVAEHFLAGMRKNPRAVLRQYTMPHSPGNTDASFLRSGFTHLAHGATMLDFFGIGMEETFTENHIDHRDASRYRSLRDLTHCVGLVEDLLPSSRPVPSKVALLVSASTERWDFAGIATDQAGHAVFGPDFRSTRLNYHLDRLGLWTALTFLGSSPDLIVEEDVTAKDLAGYRVLVVVGDSLPASLIPELEKWVSSGGVVLATATAGKFDPYRNPNPAFDRFLGIRERSLAGQPVTFFRPRQELPFLEPTDQVEGKGWTMPQLAVPERFQPAEGVKVLATFREGKGPAYLERQLGKGRIFTVAAHPGVAYLWSAVRPPLVPDRALASHTVPTAFDPGARTLLEGVLQAAGVEPAIEAKPALVDARLLQSPKGFILPIANYQAKLGEEVSLKVRVPQPIRRAVSAYHGELKITQGEGWVELTIAGLGAGDVIRLEP